MSFLRFPMRFMVACCFVSLAQQVYATLTITCQPIGGPIVTGGQDVLVECLVTSDVFQSVRTSIVDLPCTLPGHPGSTGSMTAIAFTADPDGDGNQGPSSGGFFYLHSSIGIAIFDAGSCATTGICTVDPSPCPLPVGQTRYLLTITYHVSDCASGAFDILVEDFSDPPQSTDGTRFRDPSFNLIPLAHTPTTVTVATGTCCENSTCLSDGINEFCCLQNHPGARFIPGRTCADAEPCPECAVDAHCDDGLFCNGAETCDLATNECVSGPPPSCDDGIACTTDSCDVDENACEHLPDNALCDDGLFCNGLETCDAAAGCVPGAAPTCDDAIACTIDSCDVNEDVCAHLPDDTLCDDGQFCNGAETCDPITGQCLPGTAPSCDDGIACTVDSCDPATDACRHVADDTFCNDGRACTVDSCTPATGGCTHTPSDALCDDGQFCNGAETCDALAGCVAGVNPCSPPPLEGAGHPLVCDEATDTCTVPPIPTVSEWGLIVLAFILLIGAKVHFGRSPMGRLHRA